MVVGSRLESLSSLPEILSHLSSLQSADSDLSLSLSNLLTTCEPITHSLATLRSLHPGLNDLQQQASLISQTVAITAKTADHVGSRVRSLDEEMRRVREAAERVSQVMELKVRVPSVACVIALRYLFLIAVMPRIIALGHGKQGLGSRHEILRSCYDLTAGCHNRTIR